MWFNLIKFWIKKNKYCKCTGFIGWQGRRYHTWIGSYTYTCVPLMHTTDAPPRTQLHFLEFSFSPLPLLVVPKPVQLRTTDHSATSVRVSDFHTIRIFGCSDGSKIWETTIRKESRRVFRCDYSCHLYEYSLHLCIHQLVYPCPVHEHNHTGKYKKW